MKTASVTFVAFLGAMIAAPAFASRSGVEVKRSSGVEVKRTRDAHNKRTVIDVRNLDVKEEQRQSTSHVTRSMFDEQDLMIQYETRMLQMSMMGSMSMDLETRLLQDMSMSMSMPEMAVRASQLVADVPLVKSDSSSESGQSSISVAHPQTTSQDISTAQGPEAVLLTDSAFKTSSMLVTTAGATFLFLLPL